jgi:hypothetical protein
MVRNLAAAFCVLGLASAAAAQEADPSKMSCGDFYTMQAESLMKRGKTLEKSGKFMAMGAKHMRKNKMFRAEAMMNARMGANMIASGRSMQRAGKWLMKRAERYKKGKHNHTAGEHMAEMAKIPEKMKGDIAAKGKEIASEMKDWGNEMIKHAEMSMGMWDKLASAKPEEKKEEKKE